MIQKLKNAVNLAQNMGWRYVAFRLRHEISRRSGALKSKFPGHPAPKTFMRLEQWKEHGGTFFFTSKHGLQVPKRPTELVEQKFKDFCNGRVSFFNNITFELGKDYDWVTNPDTGYKYDQNKHWTEIADYTKEAGDIKYVWEKSRFSFLYDIVRYDHHFSKDCSALVFNEILSWIKSNPVNCGPNYRCSQEISLRVLNWTFALFYYKDSEHLTEEVFGEIQAAIYWQVHHVFNNIAFSRIAVRNNHAITETLTLYLVSILYPFVDDFKAWGRMGKKWFEEEIAYQIYEDGTFLQFSMNYHRVVVQLLTWGIRLSQLNNDLLLPLVHARAQASLKFLRVCMDDTTGWLPNYGANDGALFFRFNDDHFRDYRSQLKGLASVLYYDACIETDAEDVYWYGQITPVSEALDLAPVTYAFKDGGYYLFREINTLTFIRCGSHRDRPSQADNLHLDIWYRGENVLLDAGSYKYNTGDDMIRYFIGTSSHNTIMLNGFDQMRKGARFIWYNWSQCTEATITEDFNRICFSGCISSFTHVNRNIRHLRTITKLKGLPEWHVQDKMIHLPGRIPVRQLWHVPLQQGNIFLQAKEITGEPIVIIEKEGWYSSLYGSKEKSRQIEVITENPEVFTVFKINSEL